MLVAAMNPCPCGYYTDDQKECTCSPSQINHYKNKVSGPILDRFDIIIDIPRLKASDYISANDDHYSSKHIKHRVHSSIQTQYNRHKRHIQNGQLIP